ncbi:MAG: MerR family DNA-binding transcriptional regulator [SAR324 cluster bacterium]|nr:MerR family DNA-binding transcriptional regulator [SAR324 cluster bacterium]
MGNSGTSAERTYTITQLSQEFDITTRTIRFYEEQGLINPERNGQTRIYSAKDRTCIKLILRGKRLGLSLKESQELINMYDPEHGNVVQLRSFLTKIDERQNMLREQMRDIEIIMEELDGAKIRCQNALAATLSQQQKIETLTEGVS